VPDQDDVHGGRTGRRYAGRHRRAVVPPANRSIGPARTALVATTERLRLIPIPPSTELATARPLRHRRSADLPASISTSTGSAVEDRLGMERCPRRISLGQRTVLRPGGHGRHRSQVIRYNMSFHDLLPPDRPRPRRRSGRAGCCRGGRGGRGGRATGRSCSDRGPWAGGSNVASVPDMEETPGSGGRGRCPTACTVTGGPSGCARFRGRPGSPTSPMIRTC
jgi:hypothetical protein